MASHKERKPDSCVRRFSILPFFSCEPDDTCKYGYRDDKTYWLSTFDRYMDGPMAPLSGADIRRFVSRCAVCVTTSLVMAVHSQRSMLTPNCPDGWRSLWTGYSFLMHTASGEGGGQSLSLSGSCLDYFRAAPFIECVGDVCDVSSNQLSFWLISIPGGERDQFFRTQRVVGSVNVLKQRISRCRVCVYNGDRQN
ncbi:PREDICTED: collagen alpha-2(IV) chain-like [Branchiostoma belcheri]|uniref:Collagen alpha-2(IV) chain-like n=1 Tax=Branchiostoma belcheri TaxID=7741 RepID=A0A6P4Y017_BRABE|nr:PREDICTED: collagen alpha-2(IV) chain-like [Branchiostoma belcheri]KAI8503157.1 type IV collagen [Branchiostoma belcheri]